jgi:Leucine-rich repeat (LRR) protein
MLESLNLSNNNLTSLKRVEDLPNLREIIANNNQIASLHVELQDMYCLETLILVGNPVVN